ncbi:hypothetical protein [Agromyces sp. NPDC058126]|uniref:hypothetical protein n=1 Tax=Agromyces sp. NPDC058126 TaxID=3346350 RepID=UPI0036DCF3B4
MNRPDTRGAFVASVLAVLLLTGCVAAASGEPSPTSDPGAPVTPSASAGPMAETVADTASITVGVDSLVLSAGDGAVLASFDYYADEAEPVVIALTTAFGGAATIEEDRGSQEHVPSTRHTWGSFTVIELHYRDDEHRSSFLPTRAPAFAVEFADEGSNGIEFASADGRTVGEDWSEIESQSTFRIAGECAHAYTESKELEVVWYDGSPKTERLVVDLVPSDDTTTLAEVHAPVVESGCV